MSALSSASTLDEINAAYDDNASYREDGSVAKAKVFITACSMLRRRIPSLVQSGNRHQVQMRVDLIRAEREDAQKWLTSNDPTSSGSVVGVDFQNFRGDS